jgi:hypothetical protein
VPSQVFGCCAISPGVAAIPFRSFSSSDRLTNSCNDTTQTYLTWPMSKIGTANTLSKESKANHAKRRKQKEDAESLQPNAP